MATRDLVQSYYDSLSQKNDNWQNLYSKDAVFSDASQTLTAKGEAAVIQSFVPFLKGVEGVKVKQMIVEGEKACAIVGYDYVNPKGQKMRQDVAEVWETRDGKLAKLTIYFDLLAYRNFMRG
ncbi:MAG TPA: nuclear transport factor 2 family protein [bacterium]|nr:nuclear transport factor 2 family protein [bacterium]